MYLNNRIHLGADDGSIRATITPLELKDFWRMDMNLTKSFNDKWQIFVNIRNVFDRRNFLPSLVNAESGIPGDELSIDIGVNYKF